MVCKRGLCANVKVNIIWAKKKSLRCILGKENFFIFFAPFFSRRTLVFIRSAYGMRWRAAGKGYMDDVDQTKPSIYIMCRSTQLKIDWQGCFLPLVDFFLQLRVGGRDAAWVAHTSSVRGSGSCETGVCKFRTQFMYIFRCCYIVLKIIFSSKTSRLALLNFRNDICKCTFASISGGNHLKRSTWFAKYSYQDRL